VILSFLAEKDSASIDEILGAAREELGPDVPSSSVRSYLRLNTPKLFERVSLGRYKLVRKK